MSMKNSNETIGNRTRDLLTCSAVPQPTAPPRSPMNMWVSEKCKLAYHALRKFQSGMQLPIVDCFIHLICVSQPYTKTSKVLQFTSWALCSSGILRRVTGTMLPDVSGQHGNPEIPCTDHLLMQENCPKITESSSHKKKPKLKTVSYNCFIADSLTEGYGGVKWKKLQSQMIPTAHVSQNACTSFNVMHVNMHLLKKQTNNL